MDCEAFSSNQRACLMAARALCSTLMSTEKKQQKRPFFQPKGEQAWARRGQLVKVHVRGRAS